MENNRRGGKIILSLVIIILIISINSCCCRYKALITKPKQILINNYLLNNPKLIVTWYNKKGTDIMNSKQYLENIYEKKYDSLINIKTKEKIDLDTYFTTDLTKVIENYKIENGRLIDKKSKKETLIDILRYETDKYVDITELKGGVIENGYRMYKNNFDNGSSEGLIYDNNGNIDYQYNGMLDLYIKIKVKDSIVFEKLNPLYNRHRNTFNKGNGFWKTYYYGKMYNYEYISGGIKEEGEVKNNFKFGEWIYYSKEGEIDSIKTYTLKDSVDVRFPHCIFNKKEPCY